METISFEDLQRPDVRALAPDWSPSELEALRKHAPELESIILDASTGLNTQPCNVARHKCARKSRLLMDTKDLSASGKLACAALHKAINALDAREEQLDARADRGSKMSALTASGYRNADGSPVAILGPKDSFATGQNHNGLGIGDLMAGLAGKRLNSDVRAALSEGTDSAGGYTVPTYVATQFIDKMRAKQVCVQAGARTLQLESAVTKLARIDTDPTVSWRSENGSLTASDPVFSAVTFTARSVYSLVKLSYELLEDSVNIGTILETSLAQALATELDRVCLFGSGSAPEPQGIFGTSGIVSVSMGTNGAAPTAYTQVLSLLQALEDANAPRISALIAAPRTKYKFAGLADSTGQPLQAPGVMAGIPWLTTSAVPVTQTQGTSTDCSSVIAGDFSQLIIGLRHDVRLQVLNERYFADNGQIAFLATMRVDVQVEHPAAFAKLVGIRP